jgi:dynein heavy chain
MEKSTDGMVRMLSKTAKFFEKTGLSGCLDIAAAVREEVEAFKPKVPLVVALCNPGMRDRHWEDLTKKIGMVVKPGADFTLTR